MGLRFKHPLILMLIIAGAFVIAPVMAQSRAPNPAGPPLVPPDNSPLAPVGPPSELEPVETISPEQDVPLAPPRNSASVIKVLPPPEELLPSPPGTSRTERSGGNAQITPEPAPAKYVPSEALQTWLTQFVYERIPHEFEDKRKWGMTTHVWDGLHVSHDGLQVKTKRRRKEVNDGTWKMYRAELLNPEQEFHVRLENLHDAGKGRAGFDLVITARVHAFGRMTKYVKGVQLVSLSANADATVQLRLRCLLGLKLDSSHLLPDVILAPEVTDAELTLVRFHLQDVSDVGGSLAKELGRGVKNVLDDKIHDERRRLTDRINREIDKNRDKLRVSLADLLSSRWSELSVLLDRGK